jgi:hypothetical protein
MIKELGTFIPFGAFITSEGEVKMAGGYGDASHLTTEQILEMYLEAYRAGAADGSYISTALCVDVRIQIPGRPAKTDAIRIMLESSEGEALDAFMPYEKQENSEVVYGQMFATPGDPKVFLTLASEREQ